MGGIDCVYFDYVGVGGLDVDFYCCGVGKVD